MSLDVWLGRGRKVTIGGRELVMMPLPLSRLYGMVRWLEENANDVVKETISEIKGKPVTNINPLALVTRVLTRVDVSQLAYELFSTPKNPDTGEALNGNLSKEFFEDYLDIPTAHSLVKQFIEINEVEDLVKNLQSLPAVKKLMEAATLTFGIPYLNSLQPSTDLTQSTLEGSHSRKSTDTSQPTTTERPEAGSSDRRTEPSLVQ